MAARDREEAAGVRVSLEAIIAGLEQSLEEKGEELLACQSYGSPSPPLVGPACPLEEMDSQRKADLEACRGEYAGEIRRLEVEAYVHIRQ